MSDMADDGAIHEMSRAIGALQATVQNLNARWDDRERVASEGRRVLHAKVDSMKDDFHLLRGTVNGVTEKLAEIEPAIQEFKEARLQAIGAQKLGKGIWWVLLGIAGAAGWMVSWFFHVPKP